MTTVKTAISEEARRLHAASLVVDLHVDPIIQHLLFGYDITKGHDQNWHPRNRRWIYTFTQKIARLRKYHAAFYNHIDIPRMRAAGYGLAGFGIHHWPVASEKGWQNVLRQLDYLRKVTSEDSRVQLAGNPQEVLAARRQDKIAVFPGVEGVHCLGEAGTASEQKRLDRLEMLFREYGVRYLTLAHFSKNDAATPALGRGGNEHEGLASFGKTVVEKMNDLGMIVDLAHVNPAGVRDACAVSSKPVVVTHTGLRGLLNRRRNLDDTGLQAVAATGGVIGIMFGTIFLAEEGSDKTSQAVLRHIDYVVQKVGEDHVALGSDFDGWIDGIPTDMTDATDLPILTQGMLDMGYRPERIQKILGENFMRVWQAVLD